MANQAQYSATPKVGTGTLTVANPNRDGATGTIVTVFTAGASGSRIDKIAIKAAVSTSAGMVRLYIHNGVSNTLFTEIAVDSTTASASTQSFGTVVDLLGGIVLPATYSLRASTEKAEAINVIAFGGDF